MWLFLSAAICDVCSILWFLLLSLLLSDAQLCAELFHHSLRLTGHAHGCFIENTKRPHLFLPLHSCMNWTETQRGKSFWMTSSASCKKGVCNFGCVCERDLVSFWSQTKQGLLIFHSHGWGLYSFRTLFLYGCRAPRLSQAVTRQDTSYQCLGMDWFTFLSCSSMQLPAYPNNTHPLSHPSDLDSVTMLGLLTKDTHPQIFLHTVCLKLLQCFILVLLCFNLFWQ